MPLIGRDLLIASGLLAILGLALRVQATAVERRWVAPGGSRKIGHVGLGVAFLGSAPLYGSEWSGLVAAGVPLVLCVYFLGLGFGRWGGDAVVGAISRSGERRECRTGPVYFALAFGLLLLWPGRAAPAALAALGILVLGDALGELVGRNVRSPKLPWSREKSVAGSIAVVAGGWLGAALTLWAYAEAGLLAAFPDPVGLVWVALVGGAVESLPLRDVDNLTIPLACAAAGLLLL